MNLKTNEEINIEQLKNFIEQQRSIISSNLYITIHKIKTINPSLKLFLGKIVMSFSNTGDSFFENFVFFKVDFRKVHLTLQCVFDTIFYQCVVKELEFVDYYNIRDIGYSFKEMQKVCGLIFEQQRNIHKIHDDNIFRLR